MCGKHEMFACVCMENAFVYCLIMSIPYMFPIRKNGQTDLHIKNS